MKVTKALLQSVLHARGDDDRPFLAQRLPAEFDTDDYPTLLEDLGLTAADLTGEHATDATKMAAIDADPHSRLKSEWRPTELRTRRADLAADFDRTTPRGEEADDRG